jgi:hypothetical protein
VKHFQAVDAVAPISFLLKCHKGMPCPEEVASLIYSGLFTEKKDGVLADIVESIHSMEIVYAKTDFTAYNVGSLMHPSWPALHADASTCILWLPVVVQLSPEQYCEALWGGLCHFPTLERLPGYITNKIMLLD